MFRSPAKAAARKPAAEAAPAGDAGDEWGWAAGSPTKDELSGAVSSADIHPPVGETRAERCHCFAHVSARTRFASIGSPQESVEKLSIELGIGMYRHSS